MNEKDTTLTVTKEASPQSDTTFSFDIQQVLLDERHDVRLPLPVEGSPISFRGLLSEARVQAAPSNTPEEKPFHESFSLIDNGNVDNFETFVLSKGVYEITETDIPAGWSLDDIQCDARVMNRTDDSIQVYVERYDDVNCTFENSMNELVLLLEKTNDTPEPTTIGEIVTYTLTVSVPEDSGVSYNTSVTDVAPENFAVNNASAQARLVTPSAYRTSAFAYSGYPNYASPGIWELGTLYPGDVVELSYQATIQEQVSPGVYHDIAFAKGGTVPIIEENETVYSNVHLASVDDPFVGTDVEVVVERPEMQVLARTGSPLGMVQAILPLMIILSVGTLLRREEKGAL